MTAIARASIQVRAAVRAQTFTVVFAQGLHGKGELKLLHDQVSEIDLILVVERRREIIFLDLALPFADVLDPRNVSKIEIRHDR